MSRPHRLLSPEAAPESGVLTADDARALFARVAKLSKAETVEMQVNSNHTGNTRFAANQMSTSGSVTDMQLGVQSSYGAKHAVVVTNDISDESLARAVAESEALAKLAPDDPEAMPPLGAQTYVPVSSHFDTTARLTAADRAKAALTALAPARGAGDLQAAGFIITSESSIALGNTKGMFAYHRATSANYQLTVRTGDGTGSGWAAADHPDWSQLDFKAVSDRAIEKAK
ncbi:MAG TPA: DNA gyrase modulator, partial [Gemmatimonadaceae bacterium]|nr:DNA gyrase modulator [Gemmatimonadaceae bacterium]